MKNSWKVLATPPVRYQYTGVAQLYHYSYFLFWSAFDKLLLLLLLESHIPVQPLDITAHSDGVSPQRPQEESWCALPVPLHNLRLLILLSART